MTSTYEMRSRCTGVCLHKRRHTRISYIMFIHTCRGVIEDLNKPNHCVWTSKKWVQIFKRAHRVFTERQQYLRIPNVRYSCGKSDPE